MRTEANTHFCFYLYRHDSTTFFLCFRYDNFRHFLLYVEGFDEARSKEVTRILTGK